MSWILLLLATNPANADEVLLWQGFQHTWERRVALGFRVPHRVSRFESRLTGTLDDPLFTFAQSTGVDGDFMFPEGYAVRVSSDDLVVHTGTTIVSREDVAIGEHPRALQTHQSVLRVPRPDVDGEVRTVALLQGLAFQARCLDAEGDACQSDGVWPYRFQVDLGDCTDLGSELLCPLTVEVGRAWTPGRGGVRGIEQKPLAQRMFIEVQVSWAIVTAPADRLLAHDQLFENALPTNKAMILEEQSVRVHDLPPGYPAATVGLDHLAFEFFPAASQKSRQERGRYIGGWSTRVRLRGYDPEEGSLSFGHAGGILLPNTVKRTGVKVEVGMVLLQLADPEAHVEGGLVARGSLCAPSTEAPWFSKWDRCDRLGIPERIEQEVPLRVEGGPTDDE